MLQQAAWDSSNDNKQTNHEWWRWHQCVLPVCEEVHPVLEDVPRHAVVLQLCFFSAHWTAHQLILTTPLRQHAMYTMSLTSTRMGLVGAGCRCLQFYSVFQHQCLYEKNVRQQPVPIIPSPTLSTSVKHKLKLTAVVIILVYNSSTTY